MKIQLTGKRYACTHRPQPWSQNMSAGKLASAKGTPCYIVIIVYYCGGHSKRKTLMMSTYNYLTMANQACPPAEGGGHGRIGPPPGSASVGKPLASVRLLRVLQRIYGLPITRIEAIRLKRSVTKTADDINIAHSGNKHAKLTQLLNRSNLLQRVNRKHCQWCNKSTAIT